MFTRRELSPKIGTEIGIDRATLLSGRFAQDLRRILHERGVLTFGTMDLSDEEHRVLARTIGTIGPDYGNAKELEMLLSDPAAYEPGAFLWHIDDITEDMPHFGSIMTSRRLAPSGGQTEFANAAAAWEDLPEADKALIEDLRVVHSFEAAQLAVIPSPSYDVLSSWQAFGTRTQPMVWRHGSGRASLILGSTASHVVGMDPEESRALLDRLTAFATRDCYVYSHDWKVGDLLMWDNTTVLHRARPYPIGCERASMRVPLAGEEMVPA
jgi:alpha-ketoglutarate-dependent taurine dioxygenase